MYHSDIDHLAHHAQKKVNAFTKSKLAYLTASALAGMYIGISMIFIFTIGAFLHAANSPAYKIVMGIAFPVALSLILFAGSELFTGTNMVMTVGALQKQTTWKDAITIWLASYIGNFIGAAITIVVYLGTGLANGPVKDFIISGSLAKVSPTSLQIFSRGILCNIMVCVAVWCFYRLKEETSKLIMIFWCIFVFISTGFEHSIANMTILPLASILSHGVEVSAGAVLHNIIFATLGNMVGGAVFVGLPYWIASNSGNAKGIVE